MRWRAYITRLRLGKFQLRLCPGLLLFSWYLAAISPRAGRMLIWSEHKLALRPGHKYRAAPMAPSAPFTTFPSYLAWIFFLAFHAFPFPSTCFIIFLSFH